MQVDGKVFLGGSTEIKLDELVAKLTAITAARGGMDERIFVRGDRKVDYGTMMKVMGRLSRCGLQARGAGDRNGAGDLTRLKIAGYEIDKSLAASIALHVGVIGWGLVSFSTRALDAKPQESLPVDVISSEQLSQITKGTKTGKKENPKPLVEKVAESEAGSTIRSAR